MKEDSIYNNKFIEYYKDITDDIVPGISPRYQVTTHGRVYDKSKDRYIVDRNHNDYRAVTLATDTGRRSYLVHRLEMKVFEPDRDPSKNEVNHLDAKKYNNFYGNLEWCTRQENMDHAFEMGLSHRGEMHVNAVIPDSAVHYICQRLEDDIPYRTIISELEDQGYILPDNIYKIISKIRNGRVKKHISCQYNMTEFHNRVFTGDQVEEICRLLQDEPGIQAKEILVRIGYNLDDLSDKELGALRTNISSIKNRKNYTYISEKYNF